MLRIRQIAFAARDLEPAADALRRAFGLEVAFRDPGVALFGLRNAVLPVGTDFLEVVSPVLEDAPAARWLARRGGDGGYMAIVQVGDLDAARARVRHLGARIVFEHAHPAGHTATIHLHPRDVGGAIVSLDVSVPPGSWDWAGPDWERCAHRGAATGIAGLELASPDPRALATRWGALLDREPRAVADGIWSIALDGSELRFAPGPPDLGAWMRSVELAAAESHRAQGELRIGATRVALRAPQDPGARSD